MSEGYVAAARLAELPEGALLAVRVREDDVCLANVGGEIFAMADTCPHAEFPMHEGFVTGDCRIECAWHGATFDLRTGAVIRPPAEEPLPLYDVRVRDGMIEIGARRAAPAGERFA